MSYCPHCDKNVQTLQKKKISTAIAKGAVKATTAATNMAIKTYDESEHQCDKGSYERGEMSRYELGKRKYDRDNYTESLNQLTKGFNNKVADFALGDDMYVACADCGGEIAHPHCESRPEYLGASYDAASASAKKVFALITTIVTFSVLKSILGFKGGSIAAWSGVGAGIVAYFAMGFLPLKPRGIINLLSENIKALYGLMFVAMIVGMLALFGIQTLIPIGVFQNIASIIALIGIIAGVGYTLIQMNKNRWREIKETWDLLDMAKNVPQENSHKNDNIAA